MDEAWYYVKPRKWFVDQTATERRLNSVIWWDVRDDTGAEHVIEQRGGNVRVRVYVQPRASRTEIMGEHGNALKVRLAAPPVDGAANEALVRHLAKQVGVAVSRVRVLNGEAARTKIVEFDDVDVTAVRRGLLG